MYDGFKSLFGPMTMIIPDLKQIVVTCDSVMGGSGLTFFWEMVNVQARYETNTIHYTI